MYRAEFLNVLCSIGIISRGFNAFFTRFLNGYPIICESIATVSEIKQVHVILLTWTVHILNVIPKERNFHGPQHS